MKSVKDTLLQRRSIRRYERESITPEQMDFIYEAIRNTPTSYNGQQFSVIDINDQSFKEKLSEIVGQKQIKTCSHFLVFCADYHKISVAAEEKGVDMPPFYNTLDGYTVGVVDAALAMMSAIVAADSLGLGSCPIGYARTVAPKELSELLHLPPHVTIVCGLSIGVPREINDLKPKQSVDLTIHHNTYRTDTDLKREMLDYDRIIEQYNATRAGGTSTNDWVAHIVGYYKEAMKYDMLKKVAALGFDIES